METHRRGSDGRRRFTSEFKRDQVSRVLRGELTMAELSRELSVSHSLVRRWKQLMDRGSETAVGANEDVVPASEVRVAQQRIRELERALGRKTMEVEILQAARDEVKKIKDRVTTACPNDDGPADGADLSRVRHWAGERLSSAGGARAALCAGGGSRGEGADPHDHPNPCVLRRPARPGPRQSRVCHPV